MMKSRQGHPKATPKPDTSQLPTWCKPEDLEATGRHNSPVQSPCTGQVRWIPQFPRGFGVWKQACGKGLVKEGGKDHSLNEIARICWRWLWNSGWLWDVLMPFGSGHGRIAGRGSSARAGWGAAH